MLLKAYCLHAWHKAGAPGKQVVAAPFGYGQPVALSTVAQRALLGRVWFSDPSCLQLCSQLNVPLIPGTPGDQEAATQC